MELVRDWSLVKQIFKEAFSTSSHFSVASVNAQGEPHVTPIGSLILGETGKGIYFEKFTRQLPENYQHSRRVCVMAVNSSQWFWLKSLLAGRFQRPPALRLYGEVGELRPATDKELALWQKRVHSARFTKGHKLMWREMSMVRDITFDRVEAVNIGKMTQGLADK